MKFMSKTFTNLWNGKIDLKLVKLNYSDKYNFQPNEYLKNKRDEFWSKEKAKHPEIYDGQILFCRNFEVKEDSLVFNVGCIQYSFLNLILRESVKFDGAIGYFAFRSKIKNPKNGAFLIGQKSSSAQFDPNFYTLPGGLFELSDLGRHVIYGCKREIEEEIGVEIDKNSLNLIAINKHRRNNGVILIVECKIDPQHVNSIEGNYEWKKDGLKWTTINELYLLDFEILHDDIRYIMETD